MFHVVITCFVVHSWNKKSSLSGSAPYMFWLCATSLYSVVISLWLPCLRSTIMAYDSPWTLINTVRIPHSLCYHLLTRGHWLWLMLCMFCLSGLLLPWSTLGYSPAAPRPTNTHLSLAALLPNATVISASDDRYQDHCDEEGLSIVRLSRMPKLKAVKGSMCTKANNKKTRINTVIWSRFQDFRT